MKRIVWIVFAWFVLDSHAQEASFDCSKVRTNVESEICNVPELSKLDSDLSIAYKAALKDEKQAASIRQAQKQWLRVRNACDYLDCIRDAYMSRLKALGITNPSTAIAKAKTITRYILYKEHYKYEDSNKEVEEPDSETIAGLKFCETIITALNKTNPTQQKTIVLANRKKCLSCLV